MSRASTVNLAAAATSSTHQRSDSMLSRWCKAGVLRSLSSIRSGRILIKDRGEEIQFGRTDSVGEVEALNACVHVQGERFWRAAALGGSLGAADAYIDGLWSADDLTTLLRIFVRDLASADALESRWGRAKALAARIAHALRRNSRVGSRRNIREHYDLGNDFFQAWLDESLTYSCALFAHAQTTLHEAQIAKLDALCRNVELQPGDHLLEIGTGWGSLAMHAASRYGCRVTTTTISRRQHELALERIRAAGLDDRITVLLTDYRDLRGRFDKIISIEMIEAVGHRYLPRYFGACASLLAHDGLMALQAITMPDHRYRAYLRSADFIQRRIFPGSCCPSMQAMADAIATASDLRIRRVADIGLHYVRTLRAWRERFEARMNDLRAQGCSEPFLRMWRYYFCYCEAGFAERYLGNVQMTLSKPGYRGHADGSASSVSAFTS